MKNTFLILSVLIACLRQIVGILAVIRGGFRPQRMTRFLLFLVSLLLVGTLFAQGDRNAIYTILTIAIGNLIMFLLSLRKGIGGTTRFDFFVLLTAIITLIVWRTTDNHILGLCMAIATNFVAFWPTIIKTWCLPETEEWVFYALYALSSILVILSISNFTFGKLALPAYVVFMNGMLALIIIFRKNILRNK